MSADKLAIGLTGGIGSGKSAAATLFGQFGVAIIDADIASRKVVEPGQIALDKLVSHFGEEILNSADDPTLDRRKLRHRIFAHPEERKWLNNLLHPLIRDFMDAEVTNATSSYLIKVIPLLVESKLQQQVDRVLVIDVPEAIQIDRVISRDNINTTDAEAILQSQASRTQRLEAADDVIINDSSFEALEIAVKKMHNKYIKLAADF